MRPLAALLALVGVASAAAATTFAVRSSVGVTGGGPESRRPGPDSARVVTLFATLSTADPATCEMVADQIGNFWWSDGDGGVGQFSDVRRSARAAKDSVSGPVRDPAAIRLLSASLGTEDPCARLVAAKLLGNSVVSDGELTRLLESTQPRVREAALRAAGERDRLALRDRVERMLADVPAVAAMAAWTLGEWEQKSSVGALRRSLAHEAASVRAASAWALGAIEDPSSAEALEARVASDPDRRVRLAAIRALGSIEVARSAPTLARVLDGGDVGLAIAAAEALQSIDGIEVAPDALIRAVDSPDSELRTAALQALLGFEEERLAPLFLRFIDDPDRDVRVRVIQSLGSMHATQAVRAITRALDDRDPEVRRAAVDALAEIDDR
ncbi:MAG: HEAT repeat domain-containing protein [Gemmatimonadetes bacterium]|nr:HEAT repeat domain-containing protein [Gemmatimonadota bacterium]